MIVSHVGYKIRRVLYPISDLAKPDLRIVLEEQPVTLAGITVTPGHFSIEEDIDASSQSLKRESIQSTPQFGEDLHRAVSRLPGLTSNEFSARFIVRGGEYDQVLVLLDGMELEEPFHLRDIDGGVISIVDIASIRSIDLATGGFSARYGDRVSGVFDLTSRTVGTNRNRYETAISLTNLRASGEGRFAGDRASWLVSARHGYAEWALQLSDRDEDISPKYYDLFTRTDFALSDRATLAFHLLHAHDRLFFAQSEQDEAIMIHDNSYAWFTLSAIPSAAINSSTVLGLSDMSHDRSGYSERTRAGQSHFSVDDWRDYRSLSFKQDLAFDFSSRMLINAGMQYRHLTADYDYHKVAEIREWDRFGRLITTTDSVDQQANRAAGVWSAYLSPRVRLLPPLAVEAGVRWDRNSIGHDRIFSPRVSVLLQATEKTSFRIGWGRYAQFQRLYELALPDHDLTYYPASRAEHRVLGLEHEFSAGTRIRIEAYWKHLINLPTVYRNWLDPVVLFAEVGTDRIKVERSEALARGIEVYFSRESSGTFNWRLGYSLTEVTEHVTSFELDGLTIPFDSTIPGPYDQRHAMTVDLAYTPDPRWQWTLAWQYRTGWPYTVAEAVQIGNSQYPVPTDPMGSRYPAYHRLDLRLTRVFETRNGRVSLFAEVMNLYDRSNVRTYEYEVYSIGYRNAVANSNPIHYLGVTPSVGISWRF